MDRAPISTGQLVSDAHSALQGENGIDAQAAQQVLVSAAKALARALPWYGSNKEGFNASPDEVRAVAEDAQFFLSFVADLLGSPDDPDYMGDEFAFSGVLKKQRGWKPPAEPTAAQIKRRAAAARVYELMAEWCFDTGQPPKQEAAIATVMEEYGLARSKVLQGLKEYRESQSWLPSCVPDDDGELRFPSVREQMANPHTMLAEIAMAREWFKRNPDAHFLRVPAGSALEKELLSRESPHDPQD